VREFEDEGLSIAQLSRRYKIKGGGTVKNWVIKYGNNDLLNKIVRIEMKDEKDRVKELEEELKRVKLKLADTVMHRDLLETLVDISSKHYKVDIKKNFGGQQLNKQEKKESTK
jgi:transposase-like protein